MATTSTTESEARRRRLLEILQRDNVIRLTEAAERFDVSTMTVRRDLEALEEDGLLRRVRGGAVSVIGPRPFSERRAVNSRAKEIIRDKALSLVPRAGCIAFDGSSTVSAIAGELGVRGGLTIATNSYQTFATLRGGSGVSPVLIGGEVEEATDSFVGPLAVQAVASLRFSRFFSSASGVDPELGTSEVSLREAELKRAFLRYSDELVLCIDSSKLHRRSTAAALELAQASVLITELAPQDSRLDAFRDAVELI